MIQEFCLQRYDWIFRCMFRKYSKKTIHYNYILPHDLHKRCKTLVHHCSCKCTGDPLKTARSRKKPVKFHDLGCFFLQKTHACRDIYTYTNERETDFNEVSQIRTYPGTTQCHCHFETNLAYHPIQKRKV